MGIWAANGAVWTARVPGGAVLAVDRFFDAPGAAPAGGGMSWRARVFLTLGDAIELARIGYAATPEAARRLAETMAADENN